MTRKIKSLSPEISQLITAINQDIASGANKFCDLEHQAKHHTRNGSWDEAIASYAIIANRKQKLSTNQINKLFNAAANAAHENKILQSAGLHCRLLAEAPEHWNGLRNFTIVLRYLQDFSAAEKYIRIYLERKPLCPHGLNTFGIIQADIGKNNVAIEAYKKAVSIDPSHSDANSNLGNEYHIQAEIDLAFLHSSRAIHASPSNYGIWLDHLTYLRRICCFERLELINWWQVLALMPAFRISSSFLQVLVLAETEADQHLLLNTFSAWGESQSSLIEQKESPSLPIIQSKREIPIKIGFISADFRDHSVARFIWPLFEHLDRSRFKLFGYSTYHCRDKWRERFNKSASGMRDVESLSPQQLSKCIEDDGIMILFDLTGFTKGSRTGSFARRLAPIQISWLGFPGTSGLQEMDYLFLDRYLAPTDPSMIREKPLISPGTTVCFSQIDEVPITDNVPEQIRGYLTLGTLNNSYKITKSTITRWSRVMQALPTAQFLFVRREFQSYWLRENLIAEFNQHGIERNRIHFFNNRLVNRHYLDCYNEIDFTLDTFPVTGGTTTTDALWMGVPVVGLEGPNVHQRVCSAILHHVGHPEWIARSDDEFVQIALSLSADQPRRIALRQSLRDELKASLLCNTHQFAADFAITIETLLTAGS